MTFEKPVEINFNTHVIGLTVIPNSYEIFLKVVYFKDGVNNYSVEVTLSRP